MRVSPEAMKSLTEYSWPGNVRELENVIERLVVTVSGPTIELEHLSSEIRSYDAVLLRPKRERRRTVADDLYKRMIEQHESFWTAVYPLFMDREITRANVREVVRRGLEEARGNYKIVARLFNMEAAGLQALPQFPPKARLPDSVQRVPMRAGPSGPALRFARRRRSRLLFVTHLPNTSYGSV